MTPTLAHTAAGDTVTSIEEHKGLIRGEGALLPLGTWVPILDGDAVAADIYHQHYSSERSRQRRVERGTLLIMGPGQKLLLATPCRRALFGWRVFIDDTGQRGVNCAIFSNRGAGLSSDLIRAADAIADAKWPGQRHYTYVDPKKTASRRSKRSVPGQCFIHADWRFCGITKSRGLHILERSAPDRRISPRRDGEHDLELG